MLATYHAVETSSAVVASTGSLNIRSRQSEAASPAEKTVSPNGIGETKDVATY